MLRDLPPLAHAAHLEALSAMIRRPDPASFLAEAKGRAAWTIRAGDAEKQGFDAAQVATGVALGRPATQVVTLRWLLAFAFANEGAFAACVREWDAAARAEPQ